MKVYALWHGGINYAYGYIDSDLEAFSSIAAARAAYENRRDFGHYARQDFHYVHREHESVFTPCADEGSSMSLWAENPTDDRDPYPWKIIETGPRGGTRVTNA